MADIFISYAREDRERAHELADALTERGWSVWWDRQMPVGKSYSDVIEQELAAARCVIVIWSEDAVKSQWVQNEAAEAAARGILAPVLIDDARIPLEFRRLHTANLAGGDQELTDLMSSVAALVTPGGATAPTRPSVGRTRSKKSIVYIAIAAIVAALILIAFVVKQSRSSRTVTDTSVRTDTLQTATTDPTPTDTVTTTQPPVTETTTTQPPLTETTTTTQSPLTETTTTTQSPLTETTTTTRPSVTETNPPERPPYGERAVGVVLVGGQPRCTGFLISNDYAVTASFCVSASSPLKLKLGTREYTIESVAFQDNEKKIAVLKISSSPGRVFPPIRSRTRTARPGEVATLLHHDRGNPLSITPCTVEVVGDDELQYRCTIGSGSAGAPLLGSDNALLGIHYGSVSRTDPQLKRGIPVSVFASSIRRYWLLR